MAATDTTRYGELCRLCASKTTLIIAINIYGNEGALRQIDKKIETCLPVQVRFSIVLFQVAYLNKYSLSTDTRSRRITENDLRKLFI